MAKKKIKWTDQQREAIRARGSDVLVTASAGTGKTAVLSGRCVDIVSDKSICPDVWSILVLTFTDAAAEQMRLRIGEQLRGAFEESGDRHLRHQLMLLQGADISTIHSFCKRLITEYFYKVGLDPTFGIIDGDEQRLLKAETVEKTIDWAWRQDNLAQALEQLLYRRDLRTTEGFVAKIIGLSNLLDGVVSRKRWYERAARLAEMVNPFVSELGEKQKQIVSDKMEDIVNQLRHGQKLYENEIGDGNWAANLEETHIRPVRECIEFLKADDWQRCAEAIRGFNKPRTSAPRDVGDVVAKFIKETAKKAIDAFCKLGRLAAFNPEYLDKFSGAVGRQTRVVVELVKKFDRLYSQAKQQINCLDFADLEHYALKLLAEGDDSGDSLEPNETAVALRRRYKYIFVDEYQDINLVQQAILDLLSSGGNVFFVGDVKQSIYAFRGANPTIFLEHLKRTSADARNVEGGLRVDLNANFRSTKGILDFVNRVFGRIMTASFVDISYDESARLRPAGEAESRTTATSDGRAVVELHILDEKSRDSYSDEQNGKESAEHENADIITSRQRQAAMIARRIRNMVGAETGNAEFEIYDKAQDEVRPVDYRDIVILMRSPVKRANDYVEVLQLAGVPVSSDATAGYFETTEIKDVVCLLKVLDNPQRDIEFAGVLRSPFFSVSDTKLAEIKLHGKRQERCGNFYKCVLSYCQSGADLKLAGRLKEIIAQLNRWRRVGRRGNLGDLVWQVYRQTGFFSFVTALPSGQSRRANLLKLHDRAIQFETFASNRGIASLRRFVEFIEKLLETGQDWSPAGPEAAVENAVRIMSVHKSKGLEFPVVFLAELKSRFNKRGVQDDLLADVDAGVGLRIIEPNSNSKVRSFAHEVIAEQRLSTKLAEEMRILYVAMTRARERLILSGCEKSGACRRIIRSGLLFGERAIADWQLRCCRSHLEWLLYGLSNERTLHSSFETGLAEKCGGEELLSLELYDQNKLEELTRYVDGLRKQKRRRLKPTAKSVGAKQTEPGLLPEVKKSLQWRYQFVDAPLLPAKQSVTQLTHHSDEYRELDYSKALERRPRAVLSGDLGGVIDGRLIGTATHLVISELDLTGPVTCEVVDKTKEKLVAAGRITEAVANRIDTDSIVAFFESEPGQMVRAPSNSVWREWPFSFTIPVRMWRQAEGLNIIGCDQERIIVQGIIDVLVRTANGLVVIDFKTDHISAGDARRRAEFYREQLQLYGDAAVAILRDKIAGRWLYFLTPACAISIE